MKISQILDKIDEKQLFVPAFQREYVWKKQNAKELIYSLINEYPTGTMLSWDTNTPPELKGRHKYDERQGAVKLILDGQQRITTLYMLIRGEIPPYYTPEEIENDPRNLYVNLETLDLEYFKKTSMENNPVWVNITDVFQNKIRLRDIVDALEAKNGGERLSREQENIIDDNIRKIERVKDREFVEQIIPTKASLKEAIDIFYIVNASGVNLTEAELALAQISGYWPEVRDVFKAKLNQLEKHGWTFKLDFLVYVLLGVMYNEGSKMEKLHTPDNLPRIKEVWDQLEKDTLDYVFNVMRDHAFIDHSREINSVYALLPIISFAFRKGKARMSAIEIKKAVKWFYYSQIRQRYISSFAQKLDKDLGIVAREENPFDKLLTIIESDRRLEIDKDEFIGANVSSPLWGLMKWYFKSKNAVCLSTGISIRRNMGKAYTLEWDHIFAYSILRDAGYDWNNRYKYSLAQEITNRVVLTQTGNRSKSAQMADVYLSEANNRFPGALKLQCVPEDPELWKLENFELFLENRRKILAQELDHFLKNITETTHEKVDFTIDELIARGEDNFLEFKSSIRYDFREMQMSKKMEEVIMKTIAAFSNGEGGILVVGVTDEGEVLGLENDYNTLQKANKDGLELHLRNLINDQYGADFASSFLKISFPVVDDKEICLIEIKPGIKPLYTMVKDKNGVPQKKFYVRSGNTSQEIGIDQIADFIRVRFEVLSK